LKETDLRERSLLIENKTLSFLKSTVVVKLAVDREVMGSMADLSWF